MPNQWFTIREAAILSATNESIIRSEIGKSNLQARRDAGSSLIVLAELARWNRNQFPARRVLHCQGPDHQVDDGDRPEARDADATESFSIEEWMKQTSDE